MINLNGWVIFDKTDETKVHHFQIVWEICQMIAEVSLVNFICITATFEWRFAQRSFFLPSFLDKWNIFNNEIFLSSGLSI